MQEIITFKQSELVLKVNAAYDTNKLDLSAWKPFIDRLCGDRIYQKRAIEAAIIFLASGQYASLEDLAAYNFSINSCLRDKYSSIENYYNNLQMRDKLYSTIDLATGTGKSYVIYGIAQIALGLGLVKRVLVLCPSLTIESELMRKFALLSSDCGLKSTIPHGACCKSPSIISANKTVKEGCLCVENIHAVYENTCSSIDDSFCGSGQNTLVLNDEAHHIFNKITDNDKSIKKWKEFLLDKNYGFKYMLGFTGTAYIEDDYFPDVIYRYSLRQAIEDRIVKNIDYVKEDESQGDDEKFQKIYQNHKENILKYPLIKPISILITRDINHAKSLYNELIEFLAKQENVEKKNIETKVLIATSAREHKANVSKLKYVDQKTDATEWIISVSMLTEGWDVKNVFQIVPWEDRAFNSKLLVAQVLGRGLRLPDEYRSPQPQIIVFNHKAWSAKIKHLVEEVLEIETRVNSSVIVSGTRSEYNFVVKNIHYSTEQIEIERTNNGGSVDFTRLVTEGIVLESQSVEVEKETTYETILGGIPSERNYSIRKITWTIDEVVDKLFEEFEQREWEGKMLKLGEDEYTQNSLPPREVIERIVRLSMQKRGNNGEEIIESNVHKILSAFTPLLRKNKKSICSKSVPNDMYEITTMDMAKQTTSISMLRQDRTVFLTNNWEQEIADDEQRQIIADILDEESTLPKTSTREVDYCLFKTPVTTVLTSSKPERKFVELLCKRENANLFSAWIKSRDRKFYEITYSCRYGGFIESKTRKYYHDKFNPDFFIKTLKDDITYFIVIEIKDDDDCCEENKAKYKYAVQHFEELNKRLISLNIKEQYIFHFLSPDSYDTFFRHLKDGTVLEGQGNFRCSLENTLENQN